MEVLEEATAFLSWHQNEEAGVCSLCLALGLHVGTQILGGIKTDHQVATWNLETMITILLPVAALFNSSDSIPADIMFEYSRFPPPAEFIS